MARRTVGYCDGHIKFAETLARIEQKLIAVDARINGSIDSIEKHIEHGGKWRLSIVGCAITIIVAIISTVYGYGQIAKQVEINTEKWAKQGEIKDIIKDELAQMRIEIRNPQVYKAR